MPIHLYLPAAPAPEALKAEEKNPAPEWREPPGMLGVYVRRVKKQAAARDAAQASVTQSG